MKSRHVLDYIEEVEAEVVPVCREQKQLVAMVRKAFDEEAIALDEDRLEKYLSYQKYFPFDLFPWERFVFALHCCAFRADGEPRWPDLFLYVGRGAGKNAYLSFEDFCLLTKTHGIRGYDIELCATNEDQASRTFRDVYDVLTNPDNRVLRGAFRWNKMSITNTQTDSTLRFRTNNPRGKDGGRPGKVDFDEVHEYDDYDNIRVFIGGFGKKPHPRRTYATTDGFVRGGVVDDLKAMAQDILDGKLEDDGMLPFICRLDDAKEVEEERMWHKANPSLRYLPNLMKETRKEYKETVLSSSMASAFMSKRMNLPTGNKDTEVTSWDRVMACQRPLPTPSGLPAVVGIDYTKTSDMASVGVLVPSDGQLFWYTHSWLCLESADLPRLKCPWQEWAKHGYLTVVDDREIAPELITGWIADRMGQFTIAKVALDSYRLGMLIRPLEDIGFSLRGNKNMWIVRKSDVMKISPVIESRFAREQIVFDVNPLMCWAINNTKMVSEGRDKELGNMTYGKIEARSRKNDPFMAFVAAMTCVSEIEQHYTSKDVENLRVWTF